MATKLKNDTPSSAEQLVMAKMEEEVPENRCLCWRCYQGQVHRELPESLKRGQELLGRSLSDFVATSSKHDPSFLASNIFGGSANFDTLRAAIQDAELQRSRRPNAILQMFHQFCSTLDSHSALLNLIPSQSIYCSLFCGAVACIVKVTQSQSIWPLENQLWLYRQASVNHQNITHGFSQAVEEISEDLQPSSQILHLYNDERLQTIVGDLYAHYASFLAESLDWHRERLWRVVAISLNQDFYNKVREKVTRIRRITQMMFRQAEIGHMEFFRDEAISTREALRAMNIELRENFELMKQALEKASQEQRQFFELLSEQIRKPERLEIINNQLQQESSRRWKAAFNFFVQKMAISEEACSEATNGEETPFGPPKELSSEERDYLVGPERPRRTYTVIQIRENASPLMKHISNIRRFMNGINLDYAHEDTDIQMALSDWLASRVPIMWLSERTSQDNYLGPAAEKAARVIRLSLSVGIPTIAFFCRYPYDYNSNALSLGAEDCLVDMIYNIIRQLVDFLPTSFATSTNLTQQRFAELEDGFANIGNAFRLLHDLLLLAPSVLLFVIDGVDHLEVEHVGHGVVQLLNVFVQGLADLKKEKRGVMKILFTTGRECE